MKVYALTYDWAIDGDSGTEVLGVYASREKAAEVLDKRVKEIKDYHSIEHLDQEEYVKQDYFDLYQDGFYSQEHEHLAISEHEIE